MRMRPWTLVGVHARHREWCPACPASIFPRPSARRRTGERARSPRRVASWPTSSQPISCRHALCASAFGAACVAGDDIGAKSWSAARKPAARGKPKPDHPRQFRRLRSDMRRRRRDSRGPPGPIKNGFGIARAHADSPSRTRFAQRHRRVRQSIGRLLQRAGDLEAEHQGPRVAAPLAAARGRLPRTALPIG